MRPRAAVEEVDRCRGAALVNVIPAVAFPLNWRMKRPTQYRSSCFEEPVRAPNSPTMPVTKDLLWLIAWKTPQRRNRFSMLQQVNGWIWLMQESSIQLKWRCSALQKRRFRSEFDLDDRSKVVANKTRTSSPSRTRMDSSMMGRSLSLLGAEAPSLAKCLTSFQQRDRNR